MLGVAFVFLKGGESFFFFFLVFLEVFVAIAAKRAALGLKEVQNRMPGPFPLEGRAEKRWNLGISDGRAPSRGF